MLNFYILIQIFFVVLGEGSFHIDQYWNIFIASVLHYV